MPAPSIADDFVTIQNYDALLGFGIGQVGAPTNLVPTIKVQGTASVDGRVNSPAGLGGQGFDLVTPIDVSAQHIFQWARTLDQVDSRANDGWRIRLSSDFEAAVDYYEITVGGEDTARARVAGFNSFVCNPLRSGENVNGTPPAPTAIRAFAVVGLHISASTRVTWFTDQCKRGTGLTVIGGTSGTPGTSLDISADDETTGRGQFKNISGVFYVVGRITIGDVAAVISHFVDANRVWLFEDLPVKNDFNRLVCVGNAGVVNVATFGSQVGVGLASVGVGGYTFATAGPSTACFRVICTDANIGANFFGCNFLNSLYEDHCYQAWQEDNFPSSFVDRTRDANITGIAGASMFPLAGEAAPDAFYVSDRDEPFYGIQVAFTNTPGAGHTLRWEYWNGVSWAALPALVDNTVLLTANGRVTWAKPSDWASTTVNGVAAFYMRIVLDSGTFTPDALMDKCRPLHAGPIRLEHANAKAISCLFSGCGPVIPRNGALVRKCTITDSNAGRVGALDLGAADPVADSVRDLQIQNSTVGVLLRKTAAGNVTYSFRNFKFTNNTFDVRVDFPAASTVTINTLENGTKPTIDNVNGSTIVNEITVEVSVTCKQLDGTVIPGARVLLEADAGGPLPSHVAVTITRAAATATVAHTAHGLANGALIVIRGAGQIEYLGEHAISNVSANAYDFAVAGTPVSPATGTITATARILNGISDAQGQVKNTGFSFSANQPTIGVARKADAPPLFKSAPVSGVIISTGLAATAFMASDA